MRRLVSLLKGFGVALLLFVATAYLLSHLFQPGRVHEPPPSPPTERITEAEELRDIALRGEPPRLVVDVDYADGEQAAWFPQREAPLLRDLVESGQLPPLRERIGMTVDGKWVGEPLVMRGVDGIGNYGGTWTRGGDIRWVSYRGSCATLLHYDVYGRNLVPHLAKGYEVSDDNREYTFHLRRGIRWSDGVPFTADDILYWWNWEENCKDIRSNPATGMTINNRPPQVLKVDDYTVKFIFPEPYGVFPEFVAVKLEMADAPEHYLKYFHPTHPERDPERVASWMKMLGTRSAVSVYTQVKAYNNPEHPRMWPWLYRKYTTLNPQSAVRNPYYWVVDAVGNQLPYLDRILFDVNITQKGLGFPQGQPSMQWGYNLFADYTLYMRNREQYGFQVYHWWSGEIPFVIFPNITLSEDAAPNGAAIARLLQEQRFRVALSVAINRPRIINAVYRGVGEPMAAVPEEGTPWYCAEAAKLHHAYDPALANRLLDELGLTQRDAEGYRTFPDGQRLTLVQSLPAAASVETMQFVIDDWKMVGVRVILRPIGSALFSVESGARRQELSWWSAQPHFPLREGVLPSPWAAPGYNRWLNAGGPYAREGEVVPGLAPPADHPMRENLRLHAQAMAERDPDRQQPLVNQMLFNAADQVWGINITKALPQLIIVKNGFRNVPRRAIHAYQTLSPGGNAGIETYFWDEPLNQDDPSTVAALKELVIAPVPRLDGGEDDPTGATQIAAGAWIAPLIRWLLVGIAGLFVIMLVVRHPFIRKRIVIMFPMLVVISIMVFVIIQLPPGDYTTVRIAQLQQEGDQVQLQQIQEIRRNFLLDEPAIVRYVHWMGFRWFFTLAQKDKGLLQGHLGLSMKDNTPVNTLVGDRLLLTFLITLGSVLLTWVIALPVGIYSAARQYSIGDYFFTTVAFLGMCVPSFLLALVLMVATGVIGLFSPEFSAMEGWNAAKVIDLLKHIWLPVVIVGLSSTAGMIRVMRANLLDELKKPYVTTARAKGMRPARLLLKYPVRVALNPFVSGIGGLFPSLVSGNAIIAMVLGLPTVGPLLLNAVMDQDMYLAGSMLMVLGLLSMFGTLASDLLLLWLDPRIRYEK